MDDLNITVRELNYEDVNGVVGYWMTANDDHLKGMGADPSKLPDEDGFRSMLTANVDLPYEEKASFCLIWVLDGEAIGHSNINNISFANEATMHLHLWKMGLRQKGLGFQFMKRCIPLFFEKYKLSRLICEPYALNTAPNKTIKKLGFHFEKKYTTIPGNINFEQEVNRWVLTYDRFKEVFKVAS